jgi:DNA primase
MGQGIINSDDIATLKDKVSIEDIVGEVVTLRRVGALYRGLCPFHDDSRPSFDISPDKKIWVCRSHCGSGDVYSFIQKTKNLSFVEAVEFLADKVGFQLRYSGTSAASSGEGRSKRKALIEMHKIAADFYRKQLATPVASEGRKYLSERQFTEEEIEDFSIGYAPNGWDSLLGVLKEKGFSESDILLAGLATKSEAGKIYDRFRDRLTWTIFNTTGEPVGFGARKLSESDQGPKWLNTPETPIYKKSEVLYGLSKARTAIGKDQIAVVVEGYGDVMACHLSGVPYAVAACGTAFTRDHVNMIRRIIRDGDSYKGKVIFTFDGDSAGIQAAKRAYKEAERFASQTYVAVAPEGMDPLDLRIQKGSAAVRELIASAIPIAEFMITEQIKEYNLSSGEGRVNALRAILPLLKDIKDPLLLQEYVKKSAGLIGIALEDAQKAYNSYLRNSKEESSYAVSEAPSDDEIAVALPLASDMSLSSERELIKILYQSAARHKIDLYGGAFKSKLYGELFEAYLALPEIGSPSEHIVETYRDNESLRTFTSLLVIEDTLISKDKSKEKEVLEKLANQILYTDTEEKIKELRLRIGKLQGDSPDFSETMQQIMQLEAFKRTLR